MISTITGLATRKESVLQAPDVRKGTREVMTDEVNEGAKHEIKIEQFSQSPENKNEHEKFKDC